MSKLPQRLLLPSCCSLLLGALAQAQLHSANFDALAEGGLGLSYSEDGILFSELDQYLGSGTNGHFTAEDASGSLAGMTGFTSPNCLGFGGYSPGPGAAFSRCGTFKITPPGTFDQAQLTLFLAGSISTGNLVTFEARLAGALVASDSVVVPSSFGPHTFTLSVSGVTFDTLHMVGSGSEHSGSFFALVDSVQIGSTDVGSPYCFGDGTGAACPCGNFGAAGEGCANSTGSGATLAGSGSASVAAADLVLSGSNLVPGQPGLYFQANTQINGGLGNPFGDGLRCAGGAVQRLQVRTASGAGTSSTTVDIVAQGGVLAGNTHTYQLWYRDPTSSPCGTGFNLTNGLSVAWTL